MGYTYRTRTTYGAFGLTEKSVSYLRVMDRFNAEPIAKQRLKILEFSDKYGVNTAAEAYMITARTIYNWKKKYKDSGRLYKGIIVYDPNSLIPKSRRPHHTRSSIIRPEVISQIRDIRYSHGCLGKRMIKPLLDKYCLENGFPCISEPTIGNIIKKKGMLPKNTRKYHNPSRAKRKTRFKQRVRYSPKINYNGYLEIDTIIRYLPDDKIYIFNAIDVRNKMMYSRAYTRKSTACAKDFLDRVFEFYPYEIVAIQTDNGTEFERFFDDYLKQKQVEHNYIPTRTPRVNGFIERANRTLKQEFLYEHEYLIDSKGLKTFNEKLEEYLQWYNNERPHTSLKGLTPITLLK